MQTIAVAFALSRFCRFWLVIVICCSIQAQTYRFSCPNVHGGYQAIKWSPGYDAYIPADHLTGPTTCTHWQFGDTNKIYKGDGYADLGDGWPTQSARVYQTYYFTGANNPPPVPAWQSSLQNFVGQTRNYGHFTPAVGSTLSAADEDNVPFDCEKYNAFAYADLSDMYGNLSVSGSTQQNGVARFYGSASNPLESSFATITWDMTMHMNGNDPTDARVTQVDYNHTCFPQHIMKAQRFTVYSWGPPRADVSYITGCLLFHQGMISGTTYPNKKVPCD